MQGFGDLFSILQEVCQFVFADDVAQSGPGDERNGVFIFLNFEGGFFSIPNGPIDDGIDVDRDSVFCQGRVGSNVRNPDSLVDIFIDPVDDGNDEKPTRTF